MMFFAPMCRLTLLAAAGCAAMTVAVVALGSSPSSAAPSCVTQPNLKMAGGRHWYYRTDPASKRKCWYVKGRESSGRASAREPAIKPAPPLPRPRQSLQVVWDQLFPSNSLYEPPTRYTDTERPADPVPAAVASDEQTGGERHDPPPVSAAFIVMEPPAAPADERRTIGLIAVGVILMALATAAAAKHWRAGRVSGDRRADYVALLSRSLASVDPDDREARADIYACARRVLREQLRATEPPVGETVIIAELAALDAAIAQIELQSTHRRKLAPVLQHEPAERAFTPRFGSGGTRARRRLDKLALWPLRASRTA